MPRPGPRPYECLRRAWHSEMHQPMRGNIIQQIFRIVSEFHSCATKNNREWQEKLPAVVFKAEEIMYSKANSEEEYSNLETLSDRVNNAVDLIIRRDETTETGDFLPPCVEAALNLGCIPVKASRSQRHSIPSCYLGHGIQNSFPGNLNLPLLHQHPFENHKYLSQEMASFGFMVSEFGQSFLNDSPPHCVNSSTMNCSSAYQPCYDSQQQNAGIMPPEAPLSCSVLVGVPINPRLEKVVLKNFFGSDDSVKSAEGRASVSQGAEEFECDLSLRLGPCSDAYMSVESCFFS